MRGLRSTLALLVVLVGLGAYIYFVLVEEAGFDDHEAGQAVPEPRSVQDRRSQGQDRTRAMSPTLKKDGGTWKIVSPIQVTAADSDATSLANALGDIEIVRVVDENPTDLKQYGLDAPRIDVEFKSAEAKTVRPSAVGDKTRDRRQPLRAAGRSRSASC